MEKFVVIVFPNGLQGQIWSTMLRSQRLSVIWESPDVLLPHTLKALQQQQTLPDLLILDTRLHHLQPLHLCRWSQKHNLNVEILLVNGMQSHILAAERKWALSQGAADLLPRICQKSLISGAATNLRKALDLLEVLHYDQHALIRSLLRISPNSTRKARCSKPDETLTMQRMLGG